MTIVATATTAPVPREALAGDATANKRHYRSPKRESEAAAKCAALIAAVLSLAAKGIFRAGAEEIADAAQVRRQAICRYYGSVDILYRVVAREYWRQVMDGLPVSHDYLDQFDERENKDLVWQLLVGRPREMSAAELDGARKDGAR
ncbi:MAG: hypothetical protein IKE60_34435 [Reyranella sp.]|uniref:hypothetical protein n=1 Tax=Reyranella sp. TaxID=1929291 RepID=UPI0025DFBA31|nr:hypothetical protein [Reyranella sp.]MBR2819819.1 hypothetical protein [Reyranella sp.]